jgi:hypothetical protein
MWGMTNKRGVFLHRKNALQSPSKTEAEKFKNRKGLIIGGGGRLFGWKSGEVCLLFILLVEIERREVNRKKRLR